MAGPRVRDLRLAPATRRRRRLVKIQTHRGKPRTMYWCAHCERYSINIATHLCGKRQA